MAILTYLGLQFLLPYQLHHKENIMGEFKPMVKMETTEPSIELKLKKGGSVSEAFKNAKASAKGEHGHSPMKKADGGSLGALGALASTSPMIGRQAVDAPMRAPLRPSLADRRKAMAIKAAMQKAAMQKAAMASQSASPMQASPLKKGGKAEGTKAEEKGESKSEMNKETKAGKPKGYATGGVAKSNGGGYATGGVAKANGGGYATGGVVDGQGGFKKGGSTKKFANGGSAVAMPEGKKKPTPPVAINMLSGTYKKGGSAKKFADGGDAEQRANTKGYEDFYKNDAAENEADSKAVHDAMMYLPKKIKSLYDKAKGALSGQGAVTDTERTMYDKAKGALSGQGAVTDTERTISRTVTPAKKCGGKVKK